MPWIPPRRREPEAAASARSFAPSSPAEEPPPSTTALVSIFGVAPRIASLPALAAGGIVCFFANRHWVFRAGRGSLPVQAALYLVVELAALALNGLVYDAAMRAAILHAHPSWYAPARLVTSHVVFLVWSYPLWRLVFRVRRQPLV